MRLLGFSIRLRTQRTEVIKMKRRGIRSQKKGLRRERVDERRRVDAIRSPVHTVSNLQCMFLLSRNLRVKRHRDFRNHISRHRIRSFHNPIRARGIQLRAIDGIRERTTAPLVPSCLPRRLNVAESILRS